VVIGAFLGGRSGAEPPAQKKAGVAEHPQVFGHAGLLVDGSPGTAGLPFPQSSNALTYL
jgi:hypothetical protein